MRSTPSFLFRTIAPEIHAEQRMKISLSRPASHSVRRTVGAVFQTGHLWPGRSAWFAACIARHNVAFTSRFPHPALA